MFLIHLIYAGVAVVMSLVSALSNTALTPFQALDLVNISTIWFFRSLIDLNIRPAPQAHVKLASTSFFNSISVVPIDAHSLITRRPAMVPAVIVNTTSALAVRPTVFQVTLVSAESGSAQDICPWMPVALIALADIVPTTPVTQGPSPFAATSTPASPAQTTTVGRSSTSPVFVGTFAIVLLVTVSVAALSASCIVGFEHPSSSVPASLPRSVKGVVGHDHSESTLVVVSTYLVLSLISPLIVSLTGTTG